MANTETVNVRMVACDILLEMDKSGEYSNLLLNQVLSKYNYWPVRDKSFCKRLVEGCVERRIQLDYVIDQFSKTKVNKMKPLIRTLLRLSTYQLLFMDSIPDSAVCNEACKIADKRGFHTLKGFVNGVLRSIQRGKDSIPYPDKEKDFVAYLSVMYSVPEFLVRLWMEEYSAKEVEAILSGLLKERPVSIRFVSHLLEEEIKEYVKEWQEEGVLVTKSQLLPYAYHLKGVSGVENLSGFEEGVFYVQDVSSMLAVEAAGIKEGDLVLDVCAAPGGKSLLASEKTGVSGKVIARDLTEYKTNMIRENVERLQVENVMVQCKDATVLDERMVERADVLLADLPCSGLGIMGRKSDIKYHCTKESLEDIVTLQKNIIDTIWQYVKAGGTMLFSTCTIRQAENEDMVAYITENYPFELEEITLPNMELVKNQAILRKNGCVQLLPGMGETDGFFFARLKRKS